MHGRKGALKEAIEYVSKPWIPVNGELLREVQRKLGAGLYSENKAELVKDLKKDIALFAYCLRRLKDFVGTKSVDVGPVEFLKGLDADGLTKIINVSEDEISTHRLDPNMKPQVQRMKHSIISASATEVLATKANIDGDLAFSCAQFRQLGLTLVAWNYPRVYMKALSSLKGSNEPLETLLAKVLGYSPVQLGVQAALSWNECPELMVGLGSEAFFSEEGSSAKAALPANNALGEKLAKFSEIGEAFARVNDETYPKTPKDWEAVKGEVTSILGPGGVSLIKAKIKENSSEYTIAHPDLFKLDIAPEPPRRAGSQFAGKLFAENTYAKKCPNWLQDRIRALYEYVLQGEISIEGLNVLVTEVIPTAGFLRGCAYLVDPERMLLVPSLRIGDVNIARFKPLNCSTVGNSAHPAVEALSYSTPIIQEKVFINGDLVSHITAAFGNNERAGVLYLEMSDELILGERQAPLLYFKAIRQCLNDCLNLRVS